MINYLKNIIIFGIKTATVLKKNLILNLPREKTFLKTKIISSGDESKDSSDKQKSNVDPNYIFKW